MFSNVLMTTLTPLCNTNENTCWQNRPFTTIWPEDQQPTSTTQSWEKPKYAEVKKTIKKKKRLRTAFSTEQVQVLEKTYFERRYVDAQKRRQLAQTLNIGERSIKVWFQNRRMKEKRESSESSDSSTEAISLEDSPSRPLPTSPSLNQVEVSYVTPEVGSNQPLSNMISEVVDNEAYSNQAYSSLAYSNQAYSNQAYSNQDYIHYQPNSHFCQNSSNYYCNNSTESQTSAMSMLPQAEPFADDRSTYPTSYYPTLVDYFLGESYQSESSNNINSEIQWSLNDIDLNYFQN
ncbi:hypothetical protein ABMA27_001439 [Loxostege sticticalis]|uniref:Homeobox domain-containing protein n=1 Tax=Loxostege sticticalis TaxID=481309 RepID=A0ABR3HYS2_LOXSC